MLTLSFIVWCHHYSREYLNDFYLTNNNLPDVLNESTIKQMKREKNLCVNGNLLLGTRQTLQRCAFEYKGPKIIWLTLNKKYNKTNMTIVGINRCKIQILLVFYLLSVKNASEVTKCVVLVVFYTKNGFQPLNRSHFTPTGHQ